VRAAIYLRISQDATGEQAGVMRQQEDCERLVEAQGWTLVETYTDNDISASNGRARPGYKALLAAIQAGSVDAIVAWHPDRLYRKLRDLEALVDAIEKRDVIMRTVRAGEIDLSTPTGRMLARILSATAQAEGEIKADRWQRSVRQRREAGAMPGSGPRMKGWTRDGTLLPDEAAEIRWLAQQVIDGVSQTALSRAARDKGIRSTVGNVMTKQSIRRLLLNPRLAGYSVLKGDIVGTGTWEPILDVETWETVCSLLTASGARPTPPRVASLSGLIWCGGCGARMSTGSRTTKRGGLSRTYRCTRDTAGNGCMKVAMTAGVVEETVEAYARERLSDPRIRERIEALQAVPKAELAEMTSLQDRLVELERQLEEPGVPVAAILRAMDRTRQRLAELSDLIARAPMAPLPSLETPWPADVQRRRALVGLVVERVVIKPSTKPGIVDLERIEIDPR
jgi:DNA invertase Pin-like site-specific DNA recombinase